ncbi:glycerophosphodiester phosphodiesterase [[Leptolyngbya] sp. PCC 7376]|uniref:glycerophosphodiester phosphodiesterase n=1 Tax=[Leptolyngbya] sp. PCC 7376 TaxID=111781 RepID=UPI0013583D3F|nr:glycerophosphodiester phosphodiesterase [[Leptolyngbya] sp. PCC 7376]
MTNRKKGGDRPLIFGHRGVPLVHQENTLAGFQEAIALGLDGVELDVFLTKDNQLVVFHDADTKRLTGVSGKITEMTWAEIQQLDIQPVINVGQRMLYFEQSEKIPLLKDVLAIAKNKLRINLEIKPISSPWRQRETVAAVLALLNELEMNRQVFISSFDIWAIFWLRQLTATPNYGLILAVDSPAWFQSPLTSTLLNMSLLSLNLDLGDSETLAKAQKKGLAIALWTIFSRNALSHEAEEKQIRRFLAQKVDYLITDDPVKLKTFLNRP